MSERNGLAVVPPSAPAVVTENEWSAARKQFVLDNYCNNAPTAVALVFLEEAMRRGLSPEAKQIYLIPRKDKKTGETKWITQTSIDGYRVIADRTRRYAGSDDAVLSMRSDGRTPERATTTVYKMVEGQRCPFTASAYWDEYNAGQNLWNSMPRVMLSKCSEALALRKAFPAELSGLYTDAEMDQAGVVDTRSSVAVAESARSVRVDQSTGEIAEKASALTDEGDQPCAIDGCPGVCNAEWVDFSHRKYGHPLCNKHSAMAKRGELDGALARLNDPTVQLSPPPVIEAAATVAKNGESTWNEFWPWAKQHHIKNEEDFVGLTNRGTKGLSPSAARDLMEAALEELARAVVAQEDEVIDAPADLFPDVEFGSDSPDRYTN